MGRVSFRGTVLISDLESKREVRYKLENDLDIPLVPFMPLTFKGVESFEIKVPGVPSSFTGSVSQTERSFEGFAKIEQARFARKGLPGSIDFRFSPGTRDPFVARGLLDADVRRGAARIPRLFTGPMVNLKAVGFPNDKDVVLEPHDKSFFGSGSFKLQP